MRVHSYSNGGYGITGVNPDGGVMTMPLRLVLTPTANLEAVTKGYVDDAASSFNASTILGTFNSARLPGWSGEEVNSAGGGVFELSATGVTAGTYSKVTVDSKGRVISGGSLTVDDIPSLSWSKVINRPSTLGGYGITDVVSLSGGTMTGALTLGASVTGSTQLATKAYVDITIGNSGSSPFVVGDIVYKSTAVTPSGFLRCNGGAVSKTTYAGLYSVVTDTYTPLYIQGAGSGQPWRQQYDINTAAHSANFNFTQTTPLPSGRGYAQAVVTKNRVYLIGNNSGSKSVLTAIINLDGTLGTWQDMGDVLPVPFGEGQAVVTKNRVYLLGGGGVQPWSSSNVTTAAISADGTIGSWMTTASLPYSNALFTAFATSTRLYMIGGYYADNGTKVSYAPINTDGTLGSWVTDTPFSDTTSWASLGVVKNKVYLLHNTSVYVSTINSDGSITPFVSDGRPIPMSAHSSQVFVTNSYLHLIPHGGASSNHLKIDINSDGTLGTWQTAGTVVENPGGRQVILTKNKVYLLGGYPSNVSCEVADFAGGTNDYTPYVIDGTITSADPNNFNLPDLTTKDKPGYYSYIKY